VPALVGAGVVLVGEGVAVVAVGAGVELAGGLVVGGGVVEAGGPVVEAGVAEQVAVTPGVGQVGVGQHAKELPSALKQVKGREDRGLHLQERGDTIKFVFKMLDSEN
jgi:hypothetical protein